MEQIYYVGLVVNLTAPKAQSLRDYESIVCGVGTLLSMPWKCSENALPRMRGWATLECGRACSRLVMRGRSHAKQSSRALVHKLL